MTHVSLCHDRNPTRHRESGHGTIALDAGGLTFEPHLRWSSIPPPRLARLDRERCKSGAPVFPSKTSPACARITPRPGPALTGRDFPGWLTSRRRVASPSGSGRCRRQSPWPTEPTVPQARVSDTPSFRPTELIKIPPGFSAARAAMRAPGIRSRGFSSSRWRGPGPCGCPSPWRSGRRRGRRRRWSGAICAPARRRWRWDTPCRSGPGR